MQKLLEMLGNIIALSGVLVCLVAGITRASGGSFVGNFEAMTLFMVGVGVMVFSCLLKLELLAKKR
ncbi:MAG: hypothetical protein QNK31_01205 [Porticoccus sp.]|nr:hypothetical protein [Porticoccus sp.]